MSNIKMRIGISEEEAKQQRETGVTHPSQFEEIQQQEEDSFLKKELKEKGIDLAIDKAMNMANITMPLPILEVMLTLFKEIEKQLENQLEQGVSR